MYILNSWPPGAMIFLSPKIKNRIRIETGKSTPTALHECECPEQTADLFLEYDSTYSRFYYYGVRRRQYSCCKIYNAISDTISYSIFTLISSNRRFGMDPNVQS